MLKKRKYTFLIKDLFMQDFSPQKLSIIAFVTCSEESIMDLFFLKLKSLDPRLFGNLFGHRLKSYYEIHAARQVGHQPGNFLIGRHMLVKSTQLFVHQQISLVLI